MTSPKTSGAKKWIFPIAVIIIAALLVALILVIQGNRNDSDSTTASEQTSSSSESTDPSEEEMRDQLRELVTFDPDNPTAIGDSDATIGMIMFSDPQCPFCAKWVTDTLPELQPYIDDGDLRLEWHDAVIYGEDSERGARASYAAGKQGKFLEYTQILYADGDKASKETLSDEGLKGVAEQLGLDLDQFETDMNSEETKTTISESAQMAQQLGLTGTPGFIIDGQPVMGAQPTDVFKELIDDSLAQQS